MKLPSVLVRSVVVYKLCDVDDSLPSVNVIPAAQRKAVADLGDDLRSFPTIFSQVTLADNDLFRVRAGLVVFCGFRLKIRLFNFD